MLQVHDRLFVQWVTLPLPSWTQYSIGFGHRVNVDPHALTGWLFQSVHDVSGRQANERHTNEQ
jgi:hypothetical protein